MKKIANNSWLFVWLVFFIVESYLFKTWFLNDGYVVLWPGFFDSPIYTNFRVFWSFGPDLYGIGDLIYFFIVLILFLALFVWHAWFVKKNSARLTHVDNPENVSSDINH